MTKRDLDIMYHQDTGNEAPDKTAIQDSSTGKWIQLEEIENYILWLENKLLSYMNMP